MMPYGTFLQPMRNNSTVTARIRNRKKLNRNGFTYLLALVIIMIMGIMLGVVGQSWKTIVQRDREEELLFRGSQIRDAITRWYKPQPGQPSSKPPPLRDLKDLLEDPRSLTKIHYLRRLYTDPMTGKEWTVISNPITGITGVASTSTLKPFKVGGFPDDLTDLSDKQKYSDWQFVYVPPVQSGAGGPLPRVQPANQPNMQLMKPQ
jgi:type II secretory pathway pseudopilin PulG